MKTPVATGNSQISFTDQVLNMKEFTSLIQSEATGPSNTTQQTGTSKDSAHCLRMSYYVNFLGGLGSNKFHIK